MNLIELRKININIKATLLIAIATGITTMFYFDFKKDCSQASSNCNEIVLAQNVKHNDCKVNPNNLSWLNWVLGQSRSGQFHFVDLIELLHGHSSSPSDKPHE